MSKEFIRQDYMRHSKIGKNRKKLQKWRRPKGRDSKMRLGMKGYPKQVRVGYKSSKKESGKINGLSVQLVHNLKELISAEKNKIIILARIGAKKKIELMKTANEKGIKILNAGGSK